MRISLIDRSLYLKGLMLLIRKEGEIRDEEKKMMLGVEETLGFDKRFCEDTIKEILHNKYVVDEPPCFQSGYCEMLRERRVETLPRQRGNARV